jgi:hypothetical protein
VPVSYRHPLGLINRRHTMITIIARKFARWITTPAPYNTKWS